MRWQGKKGIMIDGRVGRWFHCDLYILLSVPSGSQESDIESDI